MRTRFWGVFWVNCVTPASARNDLRRIAAACYRPLEADEDAVKEVSVFLSNCTEYCLLILDNCDNVDADYNELFPSGERVAVVMTTRLQECSQYAPDAYEHVHGLDESSAMQLALTSSGVREKEWKTKADAARRMVKVLDFHPLAIIVGSAFVQQRKCKIDDFPSFFAKKQKQLMRSAPKQMASEYKDVFTTFEVSAEFLDENTIALLELVSCMDRQNITEDIFSRAWTYEAKIPATRSTKVSKLSTWHQRHSAAFLSGESLDDRLELLNDALNRLSQLSLLQISDEPTLAGSMHPLVHAWARLRIDDRMKRSVWTTTASMLALSTVETQTYEDFSSNLQRHLESCLALWPSLNENGGDLRESCCILFAFACQLRIASSLHALPATELLMKQMQSIPEEQRDRSDYDKVQLLRIRCLLRDRRDQEAERIARDAIAANPPDSLVLAAFLHELAWIYSNSHRSSEAVKILRRVLQLRESLPEDDAERLSSLHELSRAYLDIGRTQEAAMLLQELVDIDKKRLPTDAPDRLASQHELARALLANGQTEKAQQLLQEVVDIGTRTLVPEHPALITSQRVLAKAMVANGRVEEAEETLQRLMEICYRTLPPEHPNRVRTQVVLVHAYMATNRFLLAESLLEQIAGTGQGALLSECPERREAEQLLSRIRQIQAPQPA